MILDSRMNTQIFHQQVIIYQIQPENSNHNILCNVYNKATCFVEPHNL